MLILTHPSIFPSFPLWVHETDRTISVSCSKAFSLLLNSFLWLFPALTLTTFWILKCEPQAWLCYLIPFSLSALCGGKSTSLILLTTFPVCLIPGSPCPHLPGEVSVLRHSSITTSSPRSGALPHVQPVLLIMNNLSSSSLLDCRNALWVSPAYPAVTKPWHGCLFNHLATKDGYQCLCRWPFYIVFQTDDKKPWSKAGLSPKPAWNLLFSDESSLTTTFWDLSVIQLSICLTYPLVHTILCYFLSRMSWF